MLLMKWRRLGGRCGAARAGGRSGQTMVEYIIVAAMLTVMVSIFAVLLYAFKEHGGRVLDLVASDYP